MELMEFMGFMDIPLISSRKKSFQLRLLARRFFCRAILQVSPARIDHQNDRQ